MKKLLYVAASAAAMVAMAPAAQATVVDPIVLTTSVTNDAFSADNVVSPESFSLTLPGAGLWNVWVSAAATQGVNWKFSDILFNSVSILDFVLPSGKYIEGSFTASGAGTLTFVGTGGGSFGGSIAITPAPVPEPATWAMMLAGVAAVGTAMRRRSHRAQVSFS